MKNRTRIRMLVAVVIEDRAVDTKKAAETKARERGRTGTVVRGGPAGVGGRVRPNAKECLMKALMACVALVVGLAVCAPLPAAEEKASEKAAGSAERLQDLNLTDEQETKITEIRKDNQPKVEAAAKELVGLVKEEVEKVRGVLTAEQKEKLAGLKEERKEQREECVCHMIARLKELDLTDEEMTQIGTIREEFRPRIVKALEGLKGILSDEQRKAREEALKAGKKRTEVLAALKLSAEEKEKVEAVGKEVGTIVQEEMEKIRDLLAKTQKEKLAEFKEERRENVRDRMAHRIANFKDLGLTEEQTQKLADIRIEYRPKIQEAGNKLRSAVREEVQEILAVLKK
jgi:Spy/CpxP family protein refolding chaperone